MPGKKIVIGIHGLGNKPPRKLLEEWWKTAILEGLRESDFPRYSLDFELVYWADILHPQPLSLEMPDENDPRYLDVPYAAAAGGHSVKEPGRLRQKILDYIDKKMLDLFLNEDFSINFSKLTDKLLSRYFSDLEEYYHAKYVDADGKVLDAKQVIRQRLEEVLYRHRKHSILLIAHSMGSIIAYDVLSQPLAEWKVDTLATIGSPLGIPVVMHKIAAENRIAAGTKLKTPEKILGRWYNFSDLEDKVAVNYNLSDDFSANSLNVAPQDFIVFNNYEYQGKHNSHAAYGYLRTPEMAKVIGEFLSKDKSKAENWLERKYQLFRILWKELSKNK